MTGLNKEAMRQKLGNITQIRELLFGEKIEEYDRKFAESQKQIQHLDSNLADLNANLEQFKADIEQNLSQLQQSLSEELDSAVNSLGQKLKFLSVNTRNEVNKLNQEIDTKTQSSFQKIELASDRLNSQIKYLDEETKRNKATIETDLKTLKQELSEAIDKNLLELTSAKVSRSDLADVLFELCLKVKGESVNQDVIEASEINGNTDVVESELLLLEEQNSQ